MRPYAHYRNRQNEPNVCCLGAYTVQFHFVINFFEYFSLTKMLILSHFKCEVCGGGYL